MARQHDREIVQLSNPQQLTMSRANLYVAAYADYSIHRYSLSAGSISLLAGSGSSGDVDGTGAAASFGTTISLESDGTYLYASTARTSSNLLRRVELATGIVSTIFSIPSGDSHSMNGIASDGTDLFYSDKVFHSIRKID